MNITNIKKSYLYQMTDHKKSIFIYYFIIFCIYLLFIVSALLLDPDSNGTSAQLGGMDMSTMIFLLVSGLCAFKETFGMLIQNGISRKNLFIGRICTNITLALGLAFIDNAILIFLKTILKSKSDMLNFTSLYEQIYAIPKTNTNTLNITGLSLLFDFLFYLSFIAVGYMITVLFYRLNKSGKVALGAGLPVGLFIILPIIDGFFTRGKIMISIAKFIDFAFGLSTFQVSHALVTSLVVFIVTTCIAWILIRRTVVRD